MARRHGGYAALLGLVALTESTHDQTPQTAKAFGAAWDAACLQALDEARKLVGEHGKASTADRVSVADALFVTQALCLYERASVVQIIAVGPLGGPHARRSAMRRLEKSGRHHKVAVGLVVPSDRRKEKDSPNGEEPAGQGVAALLCPAVALARLGFRRRAVALALCEAALIAYGFVGILILDGTRGFGTGLRASGVLAAVRKDFLWNTSGGIFLCVAIWLHLEALFALGDFGLLAQHTQKEAASQEGGR
jgi:hypothetical protein